MTERIPLDHLTSDQLDQLYDQRDRLHAAILDIDAHATPIGLADARDPEGNPHHYAVTVGALHRALGKIGHTAAPCTAEATVARVRALWDAWLRMTLEPGQVRRLLDEVGRALDGPAPAPAVTQYPDVLRERAETDMHAIAEAEARRQLDADPHGLKAGMIVKAYRDHGVQKWVFRCWGTNTCDGWLGLGHHTEESANQERDRHVAEEHTTEARS